ncbi:peptidoglycan-binding protein [Streptomyces sp. NBC_00091]|uniref:peptidoglycan-binding protein n=1 Tax=Streptomyces sp. NBC_00091 TaxID=2975648 RepID=UPI00225247BE|nr:peptidoglycan-binding protein [Streptomyces sp. NBC_00091]MCX5377325.1 peptidoglycan-binding protein [Streptomyces sp. NBC_00091]
MKHQEAAAAEEQEQPEESGESEQSTGSDDGLRASLGRRRRVLLWVVVGAVALTGAGVGLASTLRSPAQVAADAAPPPASTLADRVERRVLTSSVVVRGTVAAEQSLTVSPGGGATGGAKPVVTRVGKQPGASVQAGEALVEVSGRPVFALPGALPVYRDLKPGATGKDVGQLQASLKALGHSTGSDPEGTYGAGTKAAVTKFYAALGYSPRPADPGDAEKVQAAEDAADAAQRQVTTAKNALAQARQPGGSGGSGASGASGGSGGRTGGTGGGTGGAAAGGGGVSDAQLQLTFAQQDLAKATTRLDAARAAAGPMVPADELVFVKGFPARVDAVKAAVGEPAPEGLLTLSAGAPVIRASLPAHQRDLVKPGMKVEVLSEATGLTAAGTVASVAPSPTPAAAGSPGGGAGTAAPDPAQEPGGYALTVTPDQALDAKLAGQGVRLTVTAASSGEPVLVVPLSAVSAGADGRTTVTVLGADPAAPGPAGAASRRRVEVRAGMSADGMVQVEPVGGGALAAGDRVLVAQAAP